MTQNKRVEFPWGHMTWWLNDENNHEPDLSVAGMVLNPGATSEKHLHNNCHELIVVTSGHVAITVDGNARQMEKDDTILIPPNTPHYVENKTEKDAELTLVYSTADRNYTPLNK